MRVARAVSAAGHPFVLIPLTVALATGNLAWGVVLAASTTIPLLAIVVRNVRRGVWSDYDVSRQDQRIGLYLAGFPLLALAAVALYLMGASPRLLRAVGAGAVMMVAGIAANRFLKISMHMMFAAFCAVTLAELHPWSAIASVPFLALLAWSRKRLDRHSWGEIAAGLAIGLGAGVFAIA